MSRYFLGIDTGATKSHALIADETGRALGFGQGGPGNPEGIGYEGLGHLLRQITHQALVSASLTPDQLARAGFGIAGYDWPSQREPLWQTLQALELGSIPFEIVNDALIGLLAGASTGWGVCVIAGTSCNCWGWDRQRCIGRMTGFSRFFGEAAGGAELVRKAVQVVAMAWTRRGPATQLTEAFIELAGAASSEDLLEGLTQQRYELAASAAPVVFRVAAEGDAVAQSLITWAGQELASLAIGVIRQLELETLEFEASVTS